MSVLLWMALHPILGVYLSFLSASVVCVSFIVVSQTLVRLAEVWKRRCKDD